MNVNAFTQGKAVEPLPDGYSHPEMTTSEKDKLEGLLNIAATVPGAELSSLYVHLDRGCLKPVAIGMIDPRLRNRLPSWCECDPPPCRVVKFGDLGHRRALINRIAAATKVPIA